MAFDRIQIGTQLHRRISTNGWTYFFKETPDGGLEGYSLKHNEVDLLYFPSLYGKRVLKISFNLGKLYHNDNIASVWVCNLQDVHQRLNQLLVGIVNLSDIRPIRYWWIYKYECFADFTIPEQDMHAWLSVISKCSISYKNIDLSYFDEGSIYFHSGKSLAKSKSYIIVYDKLKERLDKEIRQNKPHVNYYDSDHINIPHEHKVMRLEIFHDKEPVRRHNKRIVLGESLNRISSTSNPNVINADEPTPACCFFTFEETFNLNRQIKDISKVVSTLHLDKPVTTTRKLITAIKNLGYSKTITKNVIDTLKHINAPLRYKKVGKDRITKHKRIILETGYHYITYHRDLQPLSLKENVIAMLQDDQENLIMQYKASNVYRDYFFPLITKSSYANDIMSTNTGHDTNVTHTDIESINHIEPST